MNKAKRALTVLYTMCRDLSLLLLLLLSNDCEGELDFLVFTNHVYSAFFRWYGHRLYILHYYLWVRYTEIKFWRRGREGRKVDRHAAAAGLSRERAIDRDYGWETSLSPFANTFEKTTKNTRKTDVCESGNVVIL